MDQLNRRKGCPCPAVAHRTWALLRSRCCSRGGEGYGTLPSHKLSTLLPIKDTLRQHLPSLRCPGNISPLLPPRTSLAVPLRRHIFSEQNWDGFSLRKVENLVVAPSVAGFQLMLCRGSTALSSSFAGRLILLVQLRWFQPGCEPPASPAAALIAGPWRTRDLGGRSSLAAGPSARCPCGFAMGAATNPAQAAEGPSSAKRLMSQKLRSAFFSPRAQRNCCCICWTRVTGFGREKSQAHLQGFGM